jgi:hypothetical protein
MQLRHGSDTVRQQRGSAMQRNLSGGLDVHSGSGERLHLQSAAADVHQQHGSAVRRELSGGRGVPYRFDGPLQLPGHPDPVRADDRTGVRWGLSVG